MYFFGASGTSFASPIVAGGTALVVDAGYANFGTAAAVDGRVIKAVLANSATKARAGRTIRITTRRGCCKRTRDWIGTSGAGGVEPQQGLRPLFVGDDGCAGAGRRVEWAWIWVGLWPSGQGCAERLCDPTAPLLKNDTMTVTLDWFIPRYFNVKAVADPVTDNFSQADLHDTVL